MIGLAFGLGACRRVDEGVTRLQFSFWGSIQQQAMEAKIVAAFEQEHPDVQIEMLRIGSRYPEKVQSMLVGRIAPDVMMIDVHAYYDWAARGVLVDLTDEMAAMEQEDEVMPLPHDVVQWRGHVYGLPVNVHGMGLYYNKDILAAAGIEIPEEGPTWAWVEAIAPKLARRIGGADAPCDYVMVSPEALTLAACFGARLFDDLSRPTRVTVDSPEMKAAMTYLRRNVESGAMLARPEINDPGNPQAQGNLFRQGRVAFHIAGRWEVPNLLGRTDFAWDVLPMPAGPAGSVSPHGGTIVGVSADSPHRAAAVAFARFYASRRVAEMVMPAGRIVPVFRDLAYSQAFAATLPGVNARVFADTMKRGRATFYNYTPGVAGSRRLFEDRFEQVTAEPDTPIEAILQTMQLELERWLRRMQQKGLL